MGQTSSSTAFQRSSQPLFSRRKSRTSSLPAAITPEVPSAAITPEVPPAPKSPTYVIAENKVLPNGVSDINEARRLLRPVSQELVKVHPEFADIFPKTGTNSVGHDSPSTELNTDFNNKENSVLAVNSTQISTGSHAIANGGASHARRLSISTDNISSLYKYVSTAHQGESYANISHTESDINRPNCGVQTAPVSNLLRSQSLGLAASQPVHIPKHKRRTSLASNSIQEHVIPEDPREHLYNPARAVPFSNFQPSLTSLPVRSTFDIDYSMNVTYAQLAEHRRNKRITELEERTGKKLDQLQAEINASSNVPKSPFDLENLGERSSTHSISTRSSDTGVSKSKKKRAPAPPVPPLESKVVKEVVTNIQTAEPPPDYDIKVPSSETTNSQAKFLQRSVSSASRSSKPPAPQPFLKSSSSASLTRPALPGSQSALSTSKLLESVATLPRTGPGTGQDVGASVTSNVSVQQSISQAKAQLDAMRRLQDILNKAETTEPKNEDSSHASANEPDTVAVNVSEPAGRDTVLDSCGVAQDKTATLDAISASDQGHTRDDQQEKHQQMLHKTENHHQGSQQRKEDQAAMGNVIVADVMPETRGTPAADQEPPKRINLLLQQGIILAAEARRAKYEIAESVSENKRAANVVVEEQQAAKSATAGVSSSSNTGTSSNQVTTSQTYEDKNAALHSGDLAVTKETVSIISQLPSSAASSQNRELYTNSSVSSAGQFSEYMVQLGSNLDLEDRSSAASMDISKRSSIQSENMSIASSSTSMRVFSPDWAPEHDLDSDDDIMDVRSRSSERRVSSEGFKVSVVPSKVTALQEHHKGKGHTGNKTRREMKEKGIPSDDKNKFGSLRKLKRNVQQSMKSAFGSISKARGTLLQKQKSQELYGLSDSRLLNRSMDLGRESPAAARNTNWMLSSSIDGSLHRRTLSDGFFNQRAGYIQEQPGMSSDDDDDDDDYVDVGDINFADGINNIPSTSGFSPIGRSRSHQGMMLTRAGVAYTDRQGKIILVPEYPGVQEVEAQSTAMTTHKTKLKHDRKEPVVRVMEKRRVQQILEQMIAEKEQQYEIERLRKEEIERLRQLETERLRKETERLRKEDRDRLRKEDRDRLRKEETERLRKEETERLRKEEIERLRKEESERLRKEETERLRKEEREKLRKEETDRLRKGDTERLRKEETDRLRKGDTERLRKEETERLKEEKTANNFKRLTNVEKNEETISHLTDQGDAAGLSMTKSSAAFTSGARGFNSSSQNVNFSNTAVGLNNNAVILSPLSNMNVAAVGSGFNASQMPTNGLSLSSQYLVNGNPMVQQTGYLETAGTFQNTIASGYPQGYTIPSVSTIAIDQALPPIGVTNTSYMHSFFSGGIINDGLTNNTRPNLTQNELAYLSEYMRRIGVPPPASYNEWALLLNSIGYNTPSVTNFSHGLGSVMFPVAANNSDLSKSLLHIEDAISHQHFPPSSNTVASQILDSDTVTTVSAQLWHSTNGLSLAPELSLVTPRNNTSVDMGAINAITSSAQPYQNVRVSAEDPAQRNTIPSRAVASNKQEHITSQDDLLKPTLSTNTATKWDKQSANIETVAPTGQVSPATSVLSAKVYAPLGFRPVSFKPGPR